MGQRRRRGQGGGPLVAAPRHHPPPRHRDPCDRPGRAAGGLATLTDEDDPYAGQPRPVRAVGAFLYEPDGAVIRAGLVTAVAAGVGGGLVDEHIAYVTADEAFQTPFARSYRVLEELPYREKQLKAALRERGIGRLAIKKRGVDVVPEQLRKRLYLLRGPGGHAGADPGGRRRHGAPRGAVLAARAARPRPRRPAAGRAPRRGRAARRRGPTWRRGCRRTSRGGRARSRVPRTYGVLVATAISPSYVASWNPLKPMPVPRGQPGVLGGGPPGQGGDPALLRACQARRRRSKALGFSFFARFGAGSARRQRGRGGPPGQHLEARRAGGAGEVGHGHRVADRCDRVADQPAAAGARRRS